MKCEQTGVIHDLHLKVRMEEEIRLDEHFKDVPTCRIETECEMAEPAKCEGEPFTIKIDIPPRLQKEWDAMCGITPKEPVKEVSDAGRVEMEQDGGALGRR